MKHEDITAKEVVGFLNEGTAGLDPSVLSRLSAARKQAVAAHAKHAHNHAAKTQGSFIMRLLDQFMQHRAVMSTALVCSAVFVAFIVTQQFSEQEMMGQGDAFLLASELPPEAYLDKGFDVWLERTSRQ